MGKACEACKLVKAPRGSSSTYTMTEYEGHTIFVDESLGDNANDGLSPKTAVATRECAEGRIRDSGWGGDIIYWMI